jgi:hypothetical protein
MCRLMFLLVAAITLGGAWMGQASAAPIYGASVAMAAYADRVLKDVRWRRYYGYGAYGCRGGRCKLTPAEC